MPFSCMYTATGAAGTSPIFTPHSSAARRNPKSQETRKIKSRNSPKPRPLSAGSEATTFTRLPPKDDFFIDSPTQSLAETIKLSDSEAPGVTRTRKFDKKGGGKSGFNSRNGENKGNSSLEYERFGLFEDDGVSDTGNGGEIFYYGKFELYEVNSDSEDESDEDFDNVEELLKYRREEDEGEEIKEKEKGLPAVMRCFDQAKIYVKAGDGGNGVVAFRREKFVPFGGPSGGDGGRGGHVYVMVDGSMNSLLPFRKSVHFRAGRGAHGQGQKQNGAKGEDMVVKVPPGTAVREADGEILLELLHPGQKALLLRGGRGGRGNASFKTGTNKVPKIAENGEEGPEMWLELELKLVADVGIVGAPNAGKSTFLSVISAAQPTIANYPFTTLLPNLGVVSFDYDATMVVADLPGLLEGAHRGFGLGHEFLRHTERCSILVHIIDGSSEQPEYEFDAVRLELEMFSPEITEKPYIVVFNKMDLPEAYDKWTLFKESLQARGVEPYCMSAVRRDGTQDVIYSAYELFRKNKETKEDEGTMGSLDLDHVADRFQKQRTAPISEFEISHGSSSNTWHVDGAGLQRFVQMTNWRYVDSERRFQHVLEACGVNKSLMKLGVKEGDIVIVGGLEWVWHDSPNSSGPVGTRRWASDSDSIN